MRNNVSYVTRIFYRFSCLVPSCPSFSPPVFNHLLCEILIELCRVPVIPPLTILTKIVGINIIHYKDWSINFDIPILGLKLPLQLDIILPCTIALINLKISGIISSRHTLLIDIKINTNWICIRSIVHLSKPVPFIWQTRFQGWSVINEITPVPLNPNEGKLVQLLLVIESRLSLPQTPMCKLHLQIDWITKMIGNIPLE